MEVRRARRWPKRLARNLKQHWLTLFLGGLIGLTLALLVAFFLVTPRYESATQLVVNGAPKQAEQQRSDEATYVDALTTPRILAPVIAEYQREETPAELSEKVRVAHNEASRVVTVTVADRSPYVAAELAQGIADSFREQAPEALGVDRVTILTKATVPIAPASPRLWLYALVGAAIGLLLPGLTLVIRTVRDDTVYSEQVVDALDWPLLGVLPDISQEEIALTRFRRPRRDSRRLKRRI